MTVLSEMEIRPKKLEPSTSEVNSNTTEDSETDECANEDVAESPPNYQDSLSSLKHTQIGIDIQDPDLSAFEVRGKTYCSDKLKVSVSSTSKSFLAF